MGLRALMAAATMAAGIGLAGWAVVDVVAWSSGPAEPSAEPRRAEAPEATTGAVPSRPVTTSRIVVAAREPSAPPGPEAFGWHPSLLDPQPIAPPQAPQAVAPPAAPPSADTAAEPRPEARRSSPGEKKAKQRKADNFDGRLTAGQIAQIKRRLNLTPEQEENWRPVEAALRDMARKQAQTGRKITLSAMEMQNLYFAAGPLVMSLRDDQKQEARNLARAMGLETVAELI